MISVSIRRKTFFSPFPLRFSPPSSYSDLATNKLFSLAAPPSPSLSPSPPPAEYGIIILKKEGEKGEKEGGTSFSREILSRGKGTNLEEGCRAGFPPSFSFSPSSSSALLVDQFQHSQYVCLFPVEREKGKGECRAQEYLLLCCCSCLLKGGEERSEPAWVTE